MAAMATSTSHPVQRLAERQARVAAFLEARRAELEPLQSERARCVQQLEDEQRRFMASALSALTPELLKPFEDAATAAMIDVSPTKLSARLRAQSERARLLCQRYERELNIYQLAEQLPVLDRQVDDARQRMDEVSRELGRLEVLLEPLATLNQERSAQGLPPVTADNADNFARRSGLTHLRSWLRDPAYRALRRALGPVEQEGMSVRDQLQRRARLQTDALVREQEYEVLQQQALQQRGWVEAFVAAWTSRLTETQLLGAVQEAMADQLSDPVFRSHISATFGRRWPTAINALYDRIEGIDRKTKRFHTAFDAHYEAGRLEGLGEHAGRRRTPHNVGA